MIVRTREYGISFGYCKMRALSLPTIQLLATNSSPRGTLDTFLPAVVDVHPCGIGILNLIELFIAFKWLFVLCASSGGALAQFYSILFLDTTQHTRQLILCTIWSRSSGARFNFTDSPTIYILSRNGTVVANATINKSFAIAHTEEGSGQRTTHKWKWDRSLFSCIITVERSN